MKNGREDMPNAVRAGTLLAAIGFAALFAASPAFAAGLKNEIAAAAQHAGFASKGGDIKEVHMHLHHTINCLVGPDGQGFAPKELNPCKTLGKGAIPDATDDATKKALEAANEKAVSGLSENDLAAAQKTSGEVEAMLKDIK